MEFVSSYTNHDRKKKLFQGYAYVKKYDLTDDWECLSVNGEETLMVVQEK